MRIRGLKFGRRALLAGGALAAGALAGCQTASPQFSHPGVARGDVAGPPTSPAFAQVAAGQRMANSATMTRGPAMPAPGANNVVMSQGMPVQSYPATMTSIPAQGTVGMAYPTGYAPGSVVTMPMPGQMMPMPAQTMPMQVMYPQAGYPQQQMMMPAQGQLQTAMPAGMNQPTLMLVNGPNGPQYIIAEAMPSTPIMTSGPVMSAPAPTLVPASSPASAPTMLAPAATPTSISAPVLAPASPAPAPITPSPATEPVPPPAPTFIAPPPNNISLPSMPAPVVAPVEMGMKSPDPLPKSVSAKPPTGPVLPASETTSGPSLGSFPAVPAASSASAPKLPPATSVTDDEIPSAPVFLPAPR